MDNIHVRRPFRRFLCSRWIQRLFLLLVPVLLCLPAACCTRARAHTNEEMTALRVGFFAFEGYHEIAPDGTRSGYGYDLLQLMSRYEQLQFSYHGYDQTIGQSEQMLEAGEIDLLTAIKWTEERASKFDFSSRSIGSASTQIAVKAGNTAIIPGDYSTYDGIVFGVLKGTTRGKELADFARRHEFDYETIYYDSTQAMAQALQAGEVDALISSSLRTSGDEWVLESFNEAPIYAVVRKGDSKTLEMVNHALDRLELEESHWRTALPQKYHESVHPSEPFITVNERAYLKSIQEENKVFRVLVNPDRYPYSYIKDGQLAGIMVDLFDLIAQRAGIRYAWIICDGREDYAQRMRNEDTDICIDLTPDFYLAEELGYTITDVYLTAPFSWIRRNDSSGDIKLAAKLIYTQLTPAQYAYNNAHHDIDYIDYATQEECIQAVKDGVTDGYCAYTYQAEQIILSDPSSSLMATIAQTENQFTIGTPHRIDHHLISILNKAVCNLTEWEIVEATRRHTSIARPEYSIFTLLAENSNARLSALALILLIVLLVVLSTQQHQMQKKLKTTIHVQKIRLNRTMEDMLSLLASAIEFRSSESGDHIRRIRGLTHDIIVALTKMYPEDYRFTPQQIHQIATASVLHDVGKIAIPDFVLNKPGKLTSVEFKQMQQHPIKGCELLERIPNLSNDPLYTYAYDICRWHHERWDGKGYPDGLKGNEIPIWAQATSIADVFDALISPRVYKEAYSVEDAIQMICNGQCGQFNPRVVEAFLSVVGRIKITPEESIPTYSPAPASRDTTALMLSAFEYLIANSTDIVFLKDVDLVYRAASPAFAAHLGKQSVEEIICHTDAELVSDPQAARRYEAEDREILASGENQLDSLEPLSVIDGLQHYGSTSKYLLTDSAGRIMGILGITRDVTSVYFSRKHHYDALTTLFTLPQNAYYSAYLDLTSWKIIGEKRQVINGCEVTEYTSPDHLAKSMCNSISERRTPSHVFYKDFNLDALTKLYESGKHKITLEFLYFFPGNTERWMQNEIHFLVDPANGHLCMTLMMLDIHEQKLQEKSMIERAAHDPLTGLLNRTSIHQLTTQTLQDERFANSMHALFIIDLDDFKQINDTWGHRAGDECLKLFAQTLKNTFRATDLVGRLGGDEFIVVMRFVARRDIVESKAISLIESLNQAVTPYSDIRLKTSIGISLYPTDGTTLDQLYERADKAMYHAKHKGKNQHYFAGDL